MGGSLYLFGMRNLIKNVLLEYLNEDKALYTVEELKQLAGKYQNFKEFLQNEPKKGSKYPHFNPLRPTPHQNKTPC